jgi:hypothetical protein
MTSIRPMTSIRAWIAMLSATSFLAGLAAGIWVAPGSGAHESGSFAAYAARLERAFDLDAERARWLRTALSEYEAEIEDLRSRGEELLEPELVQAGKRCHDRIRKYVIPGERRDEFDRLSGGQSLSTAALR